MAFVQAHDFMTENIGDWRWKFVHSNDYPSLPWSKVPILGSIWHREVPSAGNGNTVNLSRFNYNSVLDVKYFKSYASAGFKMLVSHSSRGRGENLWSIDTGMNGNPFAGDYFTQN